jgi:hypothetical protein
MAIVALITVFAGCGGSSTGGDLSKTVNKLNIDIQGVAPFRVEGTVVEVEEGSTGTFVMLNAQSTQIVSSTNGKTVAPGTKLVFQLKDLGPNVKVGQHIIAVGQISKSGDGYKLVVEQVRTQ